MYCSVNYLDNNLYYPITEKMITKTIDYCSSDVTKAMQNGRTKPRACES